MKKIIFTCLGLTGLFLAQILVLHAKSSREIVHPGFTSHSIVLRDGATLGYYVRAGNGPSLVLIPGTHGDRSRFFHQGFVDKLNPDLGIVVIESRGQGKSWPPPDPGMSNMVAYATDVMEVVEALNLKAWYVCGHSLGGMIAIEIAGRKPEGLRGVIPLEGWAHYTVENNAFPRLVPKTEEEKAADLKWRHDRYAKQRWTLEEFNRLQKIWSSWTTGVEILRQTEYPVLTVWGERNLAVLPGRDLLQLPDKPNVEIAWIKGSGHHLLDPKYSDEVARVVGGFIAKTEAFYEPSAKSKLAPMLDLPGVGKNAYAIDYAKLPVLKGQHVLVSAGPQVIHDMSAGIFDRADLGDPSKWNFRLHTYLAYHDGQYWAMWSHGRRIEDHPTQHLRYSTSKDGLTWSEPAILVGPPARDGFRYIARGFWLRDGELIALASHDEAYRDGRVRFFGPSLDLRGFKWDRKLKQWNSIGVLHNNTINNFPPQKLPNGEWGMMRRDWERHVSMLVGGTKSPSDWKEVPISRFDSPDGFRPEEPDWWTLPDGRLLGLFRDNSKSGRFYRAVSSDSGLSWTQPEKTNFPDATSKFFCLRTSRGYYVLVSNADPKGRNPLCLATSDDGITFTRLARLPIPLDQKGGVFDAEHQGGSVQYPHAIEQDGHVLVIYSRKKTTVEVIKVSLDEIERIRKG